jgi:HK97 family phage major capsid protein
MAYDGVIDRATNPAIEVPEQVASEVLQEATASSTVMQLARKVRMSSKTYRQPVLDVLPDAYWVNGDTGLKQTTEVEWDNVYLTAEPLAVLVVVPDEFLQDSTIPIWSEVRPLIAEAFGRKIDNAALWGQDKPASWTNYVYADAATAGNYVEIGQNKGMVASGSTVTPGANYSDLAVDVAMMGLQLAEDGFNLNGFAAQPGFNWRLVGQRDANGQPIYTSLIGDNRQGLYGVPFTEAKNGAWDNEVKLIGGDWSKAILGTRLDMTFTMHTDAIISDGSGNVVFNAMQQDSKIMRVVGRYGFAIANPVTRQNATASTRSPFSLLVDNNTVGS